MLVRSPVKLWHGFRDFLAPRDIAEARLRIEQLRFVGETGRPALVVIPIMATFLTASNMVWAAPSHALAWLSAVYFVMAANAAVFNRFRESDPQPEQAGQWTLACTASILTVNILWACMVLLVWSPHDVGNTGYVISFLCASLAAAVAIYGPVLPISLLCPVIYIPFMIVHATTVAGVLSWLAPANLAGYGLIMCGLAWSIHRSATNGIRLRLQNETMAKDLAKANEISERARRQAEEANLAKSAFLASMSHDLRTPLNAIMGFSDLMLQGTFGPIAPAKYVNYVRDIHQSGEHLLTLINDILDVSKIDAGKRELEHVEVSLRSVAEEALHFVEMQAQKSGVRLDMHVPAQVVMYSDERALTQILTNLLSNAVKFTKPGGSATVFARYQPDGNLMFGVEDTGIGISSDDMSKVLEPFGQANHYTSIEGHGTGLGLPIVKGLIEAMGGTFGIESTPNVGTRVWGEFPPSQMVLSRAIA